MKRLFLIVLAFLSLLPAQGQLNQALLGAAHRRNAPSGSPTLIAHVMGYGHPGATTSAIDTTGANFIVASVASYDGDPTLSDSNGNTWTRLNVQADGGGNHTRGALFYCYAPTVGSGHTFSNSDQYTTICVEAWSGIASSPFDVQNNSSGVQPGSVTPSQANSLIVTQLALQGDSSTALLINSGFTISDFSQTGSVKMGGLAYKVVSSSSATNPTWSSTGGSIVEGCSTIAVFKY